MNDKDRKIHNAAVKDVLRKVSLMEGWTLSRKLTVKAIRSCLVKKEKQQKVVKLTSVAGEA